MLDVGRVALLQWAWILSGPYRSSFDTCFAGPGPSCAVQPTGDSSASGHSFRPPGYQAAHCSCGTPSTAPRAHWVISFYLLPFTLFHSIFLSASMILSPGGLTPPDRPITRVVTNGLEGWFHVVILDSVLTHFPRHLWGVG